MNKQPHNRQLALAKKHEDAIFQAEVQAREKIMAEQCSATTTGHRARANARIQRAIAGPAPIAADNVIHIATQIAKNPGPAAWAATFVTNDGLSQQSDWYSHLTQPLLELEAMIAVLNVIRDQLGTVAIHTTAKWIVQYLNDGTAEKWQDNDWKKSSGDPIKHADSWAELLRLCDERKPAVAWLKSNATAEMVKAYRLAVRAFQAKKTV